MENLYNSNKKIANSLPEKLILLYQHDMQSPVTPSLSQITVSRGVV
jgi:hypothetical protein